MTASPSGGVTRVLCLEGPSAVGKTTLTAALARECGAAVVHELDASGAPAAGRSAAWFVEHHAAQWRLAQESAARAPFAVLDGDPFKGLWYNWVYAEEGWGGARRSRHSTARKSRGVLWPSPTCTWRSRPPKVNSAGDATETPPALAATSRNTFC